MYLCDKDIRAKLPELSFGCDNIAFPFDATVQIQPCSIDLRLSNCFWEPQPHWARCIDLRRDKLYELSPRRYWKKRVLREGEHLTLKPNRMILGCTYEEFTVPVDCAGKLEGRSSFARMGLSVHCSGDFINPGYAGHMPLQLHNISPNAIRLFPYIPICQLILIKLSALPSRVYGEKELQSKYMHDDGGPSYWWRDKRIKSLQERLHAIDLELDIQRRVLERIGPQEPEVIERFEKFISKASPDVLGSADAVVDAFMRSEVSAKKRESLCRGVAAAAFPTIASAALGGLFASLGIWHYVLGGAAVAAAVPFVYVLCTSSMNYLTKLPAE